MQYINAMTLAFENMADYINMWWALMMKEFFHGLCDFDRDPHNWEIVYAPDELFIDTAKGPKKTDYGYLLLSYNDELYQPRRMVFQKSYAVVSFITKAYSLIREWDIAVLRCYNPGGLYLLQGKYMFVVTANTFHDRSDTGNDKYVVYEGLVLGDGHPDHPDVRRGCRNVNSNIYISEEALGHFGATSRSYHHILEIDNRNCPPK